MLFDVMLFWMWSGFVDEVLVCGCGLVYTIYFLNITGSFRKIAKYSTTKKKKLFEEDPKIPS